MVHAGNDITGRIDRCYTTTVVCSIAYIEVWEGGGWGSHPQGGGRVMLSRGSGGGGGG